MSILLALLIQLVVPALARKLAVLVGAPTKTKREVITQNFYFTFLFIELVLLTAVSSSVVKIVPQIVDNPVSVPTLLATNIPSSANYFFNYLIVQSLSYSGSVLFQFLRILYITTIWPWFTQTPREEAWLQTTIPHQVRTESTQPLASLINDRCGEMSTPFSRISLLLVRTPFFCLHVRSMIGANEPSDHCCRLLLSRPWKLIGTPGFIFSVVSPLILVFVSATFSLFWVAYRHNYYFVQRNKIDTHGLLFNNALSQLFSGIYVMEIALIGLFLLVRDSDDNVACKSQAIIMIVVLILTAAFHFVMEQHLRPLYEFLPVTIEDTAADAEQRLLSVIRDDSRVSKDEETGNEINEGDDVDSETALANTTDGASDERAQTKNMSATARNARKALLGLGKDTAARIKDFQVHLPAQPDISRRREVADQLSAAIAGYPDELTDLTPEERAAQLKAAFQDPVTRESAPVIWVPQDKAGISEDVLRQAAKYGQFLQYSNAGAYLADNNKVEVTQPAPDTRPDWLLDWVL